MKEDEMGGARNKYGGVGFEVLTAVSMKIAVFWVVASVNVYQTTRCYNPEDRNLHTHRQVNFYQTTRCYNPEDSNLQVWWR
jgi:hypothetical protein